MPKKDGDDYVISESGNWNVASSFAKLKIMKPLVYCDVYEDIAYFGSESLPEELINYNIPNDLSKYTGIVRLVKELLKLISNTKFAMKAAGTKTKLLGYEKQLKRIKLVLPSLISTDYDQQINREVIVISNKKKYNELLEVISIIKSNINDPLNKNHLIFTDKEEFDPKQFKSAIKKRITEQG